jgi:hypothetical protein
MQLVEILNDIGPMGDEWVANGKQTARNNLMPAFKAKDGNYKKLRTK